MQRINLIKNQLNINSTLAQLKRNFLYNPSPTNQKYKVEKAQKNNQIPSYFDSAYDFLNFDEFLTPEEIALRLKLRKYLENIKPSLDEFYERQEFPIGLARKFLADFPGLIGMGIKGYGSAESSFWFGVAVLLEISRVDLSLFTFFMIHGGKLNMNVIHLFGSEEQKDFYLPKMITGEIISSFCLTEPDYGSDATGLESQVEEISSTELLLNGRKRWIGNASVAGLLIVWAKNKKTKKIEGYLVDAHLPGIKITKIEGKLSLRMVQNCDIIFDNVKILKTAKLPKAESFQNSASKALLFSRLGVSWGAVGASIGIYDAAIKYCSERVQFKKKLTQFQLVQEKLAKIMGNTQAMMLFCKRVSEMFIQKKETPGMISLLKAWCTLKGRENAALGRELLGGNGILLENTIMKHFLDMETLFTYEGTYDINMLVAGKEITGLSALR